MAHIATPTLANIIDGCYESNQLNDDIWETAFELTWSGTNEEQIERAIRRENRATFLNAIETGVNAESLLDTDVLDSLDVILKPNGSFPHSTPAIPATPAYVQVLIDCALDFAIRVLSAQKFGMNDLESARQSTLNVFLSAIPLQYQAECKRQIGLLEYRYHNDV